MAKITLTKAQEERAQELHYSSLIVDSLCGNMINPEPPAVNGKSYLQRLEDSGVTAMNITLALRSDSFEVALEGMYNYYNLFRYYPDRVMLIETASDIELARKEHKIGVIFGFQSPTPAGTNFSHWSILKKLGLRICALAYNEPNPLADGCMEPANRGLTFFGHQAVREMNRQGILIDLSHVGEKSSLEALDISRLPCIFSHSNAAAVTPTTRRNLTDEQIQLCAAKGGVIGLSGHAFLCHSTEGVQPTLEDYMDHFLYVAKLVGPEHIGVGSDMFEYYTKFYWENKTKLLYDSPWMFETVNNQDLHNVDQYINITRGLVAVGFSDQDIKNILGLNYLRVFQQVWN